jgi:hypothetical protein
MFVFLSNSSPKLSDEFKMYLVLKPKTGDVRYFNIFSYQLDEIPILVVT